MAISWELACERLDRAAAMINDTEAVEVEGPIHVGIDLGTADVVLMAIDAEGEPVAVFLEWAEVVRDGVVVDYVGAIDIVRRFIKQAEERLGCEITQASTSFPPGTDARLSINILESVGLEVTYVEDEPSCVAHLLDLNKAAIVDIGGGTTGTAVVRNSQVVFSDDEPTGGKHLSLTIAGYYDISIEEAEQRKRKAAEFNILSIVRPTLERVTDIVADHIRGQEVETILLSGGTCCLPGVVGVFEKELKLPIQLPTQPLMLTPFSIASLNLR
ncbi:ethanolamine utilization protein EutJ [Desulfotalea psychrophila]|nr:ethanolamine utilization protein EutJ [Desulfotalea psychrophila]